MMPLMRRSAWISTWISTWLIAGFVAGCPSDDPIEEGATAPSTTDATTDATMTASMTGMGESATSTSAGSATTTDGQTSDDGPDETDDSGDTGDGTDTEVDDPCAGLDRAACVDAEDCRPVACSPYEMTADRTTDGWCLGESAYIGCIAADLVCVEVRTVACDDDDDATYICPDGCLPQGFSECEPPSPQAAPCNGG
jgi:hypothetical protein